MTKIYGEAETKVRALDNVSFSVKKGEFVLIIGSSGSGKSTLLNMIGLLDRPTEGRVLVDGFDTSDLTDNEISAFRNEKIVNNPTIVLADEPTGNLDSVTAKNVIEVMKKMAKDLGQTFIVVTHERAQFGDVDRIITIKDGRAFEGEHSLELKVVA